MLSTILLLFTSGMAQARDAASGLPSIARAQGLNTGWAKPRFDLFWWVLRTVSGVP
jgi:hypothetical protein